MLLVSFLPEAAREFDAASDYYRGRRPGLGLQFRSAVLASLSQIAENPRQFPRAVRQYRRAVVDRFPFSVFFTVESEGVIIVAVYHGARDPEELERRLR